MVCILVCTLSVASSVRTYACSLTAVRRHPLPVDYMYLYPYVFWRIVRSVFADWTAGRGRLTQNIQNALYRDGIVYREITAAGAPERIEMRPRTESLPEVTGKRPDIGSLAACDPYVCMRKSEVRCVCDIYPAACI